MASDFEKKVQKFAKEKEDSGKEKYRLASIRIEAASNGFIVRCDHRLRKSAQSKEGNCAPACYPDDQQMVFESWESALDYVAKNEPEPEDS